MDAMREKRAVTYGRQSMERHTYSLLSTFHDQEKEIVIECWALLLDSKVGKWLSAHIDDLRAPSEATLNLQDVLGTSSICDLFYMGNVSNEQKFFQDALKD